MNELTLLRDKFIESGIFGTISDSKGMIYYQTLEHAYAINTPNEDPSKLDTITYLPKIPEGRFKCVRRKSPHFGYDVFELVDVPGHDFIEIHIGNWNRESDGCIMLGLAIGHMNNGGLMLTKSFDAFKGFMDTQKNLAEFYLTVENKIA